MVGEGGSHGASVAMDAPWTREVLSARAPRGGGEANAPPRCPAAARARRQPAALVPIPMVQFVVYAIDLAADANSDEWRICYVGETGRGVDTRFDAEHTRLVGGAGRVAASVAKHGRAQHRVRVVDVVYSEDDAKALETHLMIKHDTLFKNADKKRQLLAHENREFDHLHPDISLDGKPRSFQLNQKRSIADQDKIDAAGKAYDARQASGTVTLFTPREEEALFDLIDADLKSTEGIDDPLHRMLVAREPEATDAITLDTSTPFGRARELRDLYREREASEVVDRNTVTHQLKSIGELPLYELGAPNEEVRAMVNIWMKTVHPNMQRFQGKPITAGYAATVFDGVYQWCGVYEEAELEERVQGQELRQSDRQGLQLCDHVARAKRWREFAAAHDGRLPAQGAADPEEARLAKERGHWSSRDKQPHQAVYLILLRDVIGFASECTGRRGGGTSQKEVQTRVKRLLQGGYGLREEGRRGIPSHCPECGNTDKAYAFLNNYVNGGSPDNGVFLQTIVDSVFTQARFDAFKKLHEANRAKKLQRNAESDAKRKAKRQKSDDAGPSDSTEPDASEA